MADDPATVEDLVRGLAARTSAAELVEGPDALGDPDAVTLALRCSDPDALEVVTRISPEGEALLWVGPTGSPLGPVEIGPRDTSDLSDFLDAVLAGKVELTQTTFLGRPQLTRISWPTGRWTVGVSVGTCLVGLLGWRETIAGAPYP